MRKHSPKVQFSFFLPRRVGISQIETRAAKLPLRRPLELVDSLEKAYKAEMQMLWSLESKVRSPINSLH